MKVILVNSGPHEKGCTYAALAEVHLQLEQEDIETDIFWISTKSYYGLYCLSRLCKTGRCVFMTRSMNFGAGTLT